MSIPNWDEYFMNLAIEASKRSKDPSTKIGSIIVDQNRVIRGIGYNGFPRNVLDTPERWNDKYDKLDYVVHGELNAILNSSGYLDGCTIYIWPLFSCNNCAKAVIQSGITRVVAPSPDEIRAGSKYPIALEMYAEAGIVVDFYEQR